MVSLSHLRHSAVVTHKECTACLIVVGCLLRFRHLSLVDTFVVMYKDRRYVNAVWTWHAVFAVVAWHSRVGLVEVGNLVLQPLLLLLGERLERTVGV